MSNVGGSAGAGGVGFQEKIIAFVAVHILAEAPLTGLEWDIEGIPIAVAAETNGPGDDIRIEFTQPAATIELQAKKGLRVDDRFDKAISKIASGLVRDTTSNVILAVNRRTKDRIKEKLSQDLDRLREGREDTPHDQPLLNRVLQLFAHSTRDEKQARELAKRLFIRLFDVDENLSHNTQAALNLLRSRILMDEQQVGAAWALLKQAGHDLIERRGRYDATTLERLLRSQHIHLSGSLLPVAKSQYQTWLSDSTTIFHIPGPHLGLSLPINTAWTKLHVLSRQDEAVHQDVAERLARYHEWERLASRSYDDGYSAIDVAEIGDRVVIVGGPGAGKSMLCRKLAHDLSVLEELVMWVHLPDVITRIRNGMNMHTALVDTVTGRFGASLTVREALFTQIDCLIADGLDECGGFVMRMAEELQGWALAHPSARIVLTTRPVGYETRFFSGWEHYELLPLTKEQVERSAQQIIAALDPLMCNEHVEHFQRQLEGNSLASLAARNPLLLVFLIQLSLEGVPLAQRRASLYQQILDLYVSLPQRQGWQPAPLDAEPVWRSLELLGWSHLLSEQERTGYSS